MFEKILVPVDGSPTSLKAVQMAGEIARRFDAQVTLVHVQHLPTAALAASDMAGMAGTDQTMIDALDAAAQEIVCAARAALALPENRVGEKILLGHPAETICQLAEAEAYDLISMGSRGLSEVRAFFMGSVSDKVSHHAHCPVLIVR
jgi:nucleotide-binding universal stress UspA family protein